MQNLQPFQEIMTDLPTNLLASQQTDRPTKRRTFGVIGISPPQNYWHLWQHKMKKNTSAPIGAL